ncbi:MAG: endonuclease III [Candidatus Methanomethylicia archaeon]
MQIPLEIIDRLEDKYGKYWWSREEEEEFNRIFHNPFKNLVFTILSQNTLSINAYRAYRGLSLKILIDPKTLANTSEEEIAEAIKTGGLHRVKAKRIREASKYIIEKLDGKLDEVLKLPREKAREILKQIPGVGNKTADVVLSSIYSPREVIAIDTHMNRLAKRLGIASRNAGYNEVQNALINSIPWSGIPSWKWSRIVWLLWLLAKHTCKARKPKCNECVLNIICSKAI